MKAYTLGLYEKSMPGHLSWRDKLNSAKKTGFDFLEMSIDETDEKLARLEMSKEERFELLKMMAEENIRIHTMCLSGHRKYPLGSSDINKSLRSMEIMEKAIRLASDLGIRIIQLAGYDVYYEESNEETKKRFLENLHIATLMAGKEGVILGFETMETEFMNTVGKAMKYVDIVSSPYLNIYPDSGNLKNASVTYGTNVYEDIKSGRGHLIAMHLKETVPGKFREVPFGTGHVNFADMIKTAWSLGVRKYVTEFWYTGNDAWVEDLLNVNMMMTGIFEAL